jgi:hypothetical protein
MPKSAGVTTTGAPLGFRRKVIAFFDFGITMRYGRPTLLVKRF